MMTRLLILLLLGLWALPARAQETNPAAQCPALVQAAVNAALQNCAETGRDQLCLGHAPMVAQGQGAAPLVFEQPGTTADAGAVRALRLGGMDPTGEAWGLALARISANMPADTVTLLLFGALELENTGLGAPLVTLSAQVRSRSGANIRALPSADAEVIAPGLRGMPMLAIGRTADSAWLWVQMGDQARGWVSADLMQVDGDVEQLAMIAPEAAPGGALYGPLQAFTLRSGEVSACPEMPPGGVLVQTPAVDRILLMQVNGALLVLQPSSTVFLSAQPGEMAVQVIEGEADIYAGEDLRIVEAGEKVRLPLDGLALGSAPPRLPEPYVYAEVRALPVMPLPREVVIPVALGGVITRGQRDVNPLTGIDADDPCAVAAFTETRLRSGPGTNYPVQALIYEGDSARPDGRAAGTDGILWWRLTPDFWVRADAVYAAGLCSALPLVEAPPVPAQP